MKNKKKYDVNIRFDGEMNFVVEDTSSILAELQAERLFYEQTENIDQVDILETLSEVVKEPAQEPSDVEHDYKGEIVINYKASGCTLKELYSMIDEISKAADEAIAPLVNDVTQDYSVSDGFSQLD